MASALISMTPPNPPPNEEQELKTSALERISRRVIRPFMTASIFVPGIIEMIAIAMQFVSPDDSFASATCVHHISFHPMVLVACLVTLVGAGIRLWCYHALGRLFTFQLALLPHHKLITTGPYAIVRHPAYTGGILVLGGVTLANATKGSWAYECGLVYGVGGVTWAVLSSVACTIMIERCAREDGVLRQAFSEEWEAWSRRVTWRLVPWVY
ncbi:hypothetical protein F5I97DRAFT_1810308 [Phlebopus sp. FC_14]|nr:hypothetical protein F5I97DRAFT_1810308 [Phlebopus sp. FC_14]